MHRTLSPVPQLGLKVDDCFLLFCRKVPTLQARPQVIDPPQSAALPISNCTPAAETMLEDVGSQSLILVRRPQAFLRVHLSLLAAPTPRAFALPYLAKPAALTRCFKDS
ncbi:hypothetical protein B296_00018817 [Ensete ventricosum]|uniref:Uncharacterized protein n=1 Tax=Ensete ventricosum TaxID=4639 RepID=A0A426ZRJ6_ENSVE|nr:hypothetical protein B296_00018817 [Ensete ventricosum]